MHAENTYSRIFLQLPYKSHITQVGYWHNPFYQMQANLSKQSTLESEGKLGLDFRRGRTRTKVKPIRMVENIPYKKCQRIIMTGEKQSQ